MGFGDPDHQHPLELLIGVNKKDTCFRCELPIMQWDWIYGCARCHHFVHRVCFELPHDMRHPLHPQHSLTLLPSPGLQMDCNRCHEPCLGGYTYHCQTCLEFNLHLKCFLTLNLEQKHKHPLSLHDVDKYDGEEEPTCRTCGFLIDDIDSYTFACKACHFFIHFDCTFLPPIITHHHLHELTFRYNYPEESDLAYCDVCEDKDGKELDRTLSYYYCKRCDYIAHVHCVTTKPAIVTTQLQNFVHEHPMNYSRKPRLYRSECACKSFRYDSSHYFCSQCDYVIHKSCAEFPRFIKHPRHKEHALSLISCSSLNMERELSVCNFCSDKMDDGERIFQCMDCSYAEHLRCAICFRHPYCAADLLFLAGSDLKFRCNACGELGDNYRMSDNRRPCENYDLHLECYALPGKIERNCHSHPLYLVSSPTKIGSDLSTMFCCDVCCKEVDPDFWIYCCKQCNYIAHLKCAVSDLFSGVGTSNNFSGLFSIPVCEEEQFINEGKPDRSLCSSLKRGIYSTDHPTFSPNGFFNDPKLIISDITDWDELSIDVLHCPKCERPISVEAYSCINDWALCNFKANMVTVHNQTPARHDPLALLDEKLVDELYCPICNQLIFPPTYSCAECQIFFHKSCAELPHKYTTDPGHTFVLLSPSMRIDSLSNCTHCKHPITGYAYVCRRCEIVLDVVCALGAPLLKLENQNHRFFSWRKSYDNISICNACANPLAYDSIFFICVASANCYNRLHFECALLPYTVSHRIHQHPLVLETHLDLSEDSYVCDACEKELNPYLWAYLCSDSCGDRATSHVSCIVTSNKKCHFKYDEECRHPFVHVMSLPAVTTPIANAPPEQQSMLLRDNLYKLVEKLQLAYAYKVPGMLLDMDRASPDALKEKVVEAMDVLQTFYAQRVVGNRC